MDARCGMKRGYEINRELYEELGLPMVPERRPSLVKRIYDWSQTERGDMILGGAMLVAGFVLAHGISWLLWAAGVWR